jgi:hypothetical protein
VLGVCEGALKGGSSGVRSQWRCIGQYSRDLEGKVVVRREAV